MTLRLIIEPRHLAIVEAILAKHVPDREVWAFGSRVGGRVKRYSDLDLVVIGEPSAGWRVLGEMADDFSDSDLPWRVDIVDWATTSPNFRAIIERRKFVLQAAGAMARATPGD